MSCNKYSKLCRTCMLDRDDLRSLFATGTIFGQTAKLAEILLTCAELQIAKGDGLPQQICMQCVHEVSRSYSFRKQCELNQHKLLEELRNPITKPLLSEGLVAGSECNSATSSATMLQDSTDTLGGESDENEEYLANDEIGATDSSSNSNSDETETAEKMSNVVASVNDNVLVTSRLGLLKSTTFEDSENERRKRVCTTKCGKCGKDFHLVSALRLHYMREHRRDRVFPKCELCGKVCRSDDQIKRHMNIHKTGKPYQCDKCDKTFTQNAAYIAHTYSHTGERPFLCTECGKTFKQNAELKIHMRMHLDLRPYGCDVCGKRYRHSSLYAIHKRVHSGERPFPCTFCDKKFISSTSLRNHVMIHTGEKPFTCEICGRSFNRSHALRIHRQTHTGERPFACTVCGKGFIQANCLHSHMSTHTFKDQLVV